MKHIKIYFLAIKTKLKIKSTSYNKLEAYIKSLGYKVMYKDNLPKPALLEPENKIIVISTNLTHRAAHIAIAHELGHILLDHDLLFADDTIINDNEANYFAKILLDFGLIHFVSIICMITTVLAVSLAMEVAQ